MAKTDAVYCQEMESIREKLYGENHMLGTESLGIRLIACTILRLKTIAGASSWTRGKRIAESLPS